MADELRELKAAEHAARQELDRAAAVYNRAGKAYTDAWWKRLVAERGIAVRPLGGPA